MRSWVIGDKCIQLGVIQVLESLHLGFVANDDMAPDLSSYKRASLHQNLG